MKNIILTQEEKKQLNQKMISAVENADLESLKQYVELGAEINFSADEGNSISSFIEEDRHIDVARYLISKGMIYDLPNAIFDAVLFGQIALFKFYIEECNANTGEVLEMPILNDVNTVEKALMKKWLLTFQANKFKEELELKLDEKKLINNRKKI